MSTEVLPMAKLEQQRYKQKNLAHYYCNIT